MLEKLLKIGRYVKNGNLNLFDASRLVIFEDNLEITVRARLINHRITLRRRGSSDINVFDQIFSDRSYDLKWHEPRYIIDAGANIGASTAFFAKQYPDAQIAAVEPSSENLKILARNVSNLPNVRVFDNGLYSKSVPLRIRNPTCGREWAYQVEECSDEEREVAGISVEEIMSQMSFPHVDILKIDIEGAEREVFLNGYSSWLNKINTIVIELHDFVLPGCSQVFFAALKSMDPFEMTISGENIVIRRINQI